MGRTDLTALVQGERTRGFYGGVYAIRKVFLYWRCSLEREGPQDYFLEERETALQEKKGAGGKNFTLLTSHWALSFLLIPKSPRKKIYRASAVKH